MRPLLVAVLVAVTAPSVLAQTTPQPLDDAADAAAVNTPIETQALVGSVQMASRRPAAVVARMARRAMGLPDDPTRWSALAQALPEMAMAGDADLEATFAAARIADSLSASTLVGVRASRSNAGSASPSGRSPVRWGEALLLAFAMSAVLAGALLLRRSWRRNAAPPVTSDRLGAARTLATRGLGVEEIARRTGMAQDAVHILLNLASTMPIPVAVATGPTAARASAGSASELQREVRRAARGLRDRRLTYGPGARA